MLFITLLTLFGSLHQRHAAFTPEAGKLRVNCESLVYCQGDLLHTVQMAGLFEDSKTFVDMNMLHTPEEVQRNFEHMMKVTRNKPTKDEINDFLNKNFQSANELENWRPSDFKSNPRFLRKIKTITIRNFARQLIAIWPILGRKMKNDVFFKPQRYSVIPVPNGFIVPGGRFREYYYWDTYWIIKGLIVSDMLYTVRDMLDNFVSIVQRYGFIPNGGRIYYLDRSQPPMLTLMTADYIEASRDYSWIRKNIKLLDQELQYWLDEKTVDVVIDDQLYTLAHFCSSTHAARPRPESYAEDVHTASAHVLKEQRETTYIEIRSGAESGWDFSHRWIFDAKGGNAANLSFIETTRILPVDLNAILCKSFFQLSRFYEQMRNYERANFWKEKGLLWRASIFSLLYNEEHGIWFDFDIKLRRQRTYFYASNFAPLWAECYDPHDRLSLGRNATNYLVDQGILKYSGGIPSSLMETGQQWDLPNAWAPLQEMVIFGLERTGYPEARNIAKLFARRWIESNRKAFQNTKEMFEKYSAPAPGYYGGGGEYVVQSGFGWSNGVILQLIDYFYVQTGILKK